MTAETITETRQHKIAPIRIVDRVAEAAREKAMLDYRVEKGHFAYGEWIGSGTVSSYKDGRTTMIDVVAASVAPIQEFVPHGDFKEGKPVEMITIFKPVVEQA